MKKLFVFLGVVWVVSILLILAAPRAWGGGASISGGFVNSTNVDYAARAGMAYTSVDGTNALAKLALEVIRSTVIDTNLQSRMEIEEVAKTNEAALRASADVAATNSAIQFFMTPGSTVTQAFVGAGVITPFTNVWSAKGVLIGHTP